MNSARPDHDQVLRELSKSRKYARVSAAALARTAHWAAAREKNSRDAVRRAKRKLHQICGAFIAPREMAFLEKKIAAIDAPPSNENELRVICADLLSAHASARERLPLLPEFFPRLFAETGTPRRILDIGCGLGPLLLPWMGLAPDAEYVGTEIDGELVALARRAAGSLGLRAEIRHADALDTLDKLDKLDALATPPSPPSGHFDVAFLFKLLPTLEQQERGAGARLLRSLDCRHAVVSFATRSLGGRKKGMRENYARLMDGVAAELQTPITRIDYEEELFFVLSPLQIETRSK